MAFLWYDQIIMLRYPLCCTFTLIGRVCSSNPRLWAWLWDLGQLIQCECHDVIEGLRGICVGMTPISHKSTCLDIPVVPPPVQLLPMWGGRKAEEDSPVLELLIPVWRPGWDSWPLASTWPNPSHGSLLGTKERQRRSLSPVTRLSNT